MPPVELRIDHLSHSSVALYAECGRAWKGRYVDGVKSPTTPALAIGSAFDAALEAFLRAKVHGEALSLTTAWANAWGELTTGDNAARIDWQGELPEQVQNVGAKLVGAPITAEVLKRLMPLVEGAERLPALQKPVQLRIPSVPLPLIGYVDMLGDDGVPVDFKTAGRAWPADKPRKEMQARLYLAALLQSGYRFPKLLFRHYVWVKSKTVQVQILETEFTPAEIMHAVFAVAMAWKGISAGVFMANSRAWFCSAEGCAIWDGCMGKTR